MSDLRNSAASCTNLQQLEALFLGEGVVILGHVMPQELKRCWHEHYRRIVGDGQTGEVMEDCEWLS